MDMTNRVSKAIEFIDMRISEETGRGYRKPHEWEQRKAQVILPLKALRKLLIELFAGYTENK